MNGILIIDKPRGWTSHDVVNKARRILRERRIGHTGTLDPLATGVLVLCIGKATRIVRYLESADKEYLAECRLGVITDTQDADGRVLETRSCPPPSRTAVAEALAAFRGEILQRPPRFSAVKVQGVPSHRLARKGVVQELAERAVSIRDIGLLGYDGPSVRFHVACSKGTYVRTLCSDLGLRLGCGAHLTALVRTRAGRFSLAQALSMEQFADLAAAGREDEAAISLDEALDDHPGITVSAPDARKILHGNPVSGYAACATAGPRDRIRLREPGGALIAMGVVKAGTISPEVVLA
jgi:tRNA pseudouridine55 synthase